MRRALIREDGGLRKTGHGQNSVSHGFDCGVALGGSSGTGPGATRGRYNPPRQPHGDGHREAVVRSEDVEKVLSVVDDDSKHFDP